MVLAIGDASNAPPTEGMAPVILLWVITGIGATLGKSLFSSWTCGEMKRKNFADLPSLQFQAGKLPIRLILSETGVLELL